MPTPARPSNPDLETRFKEFSASVLESFIKDRGEAALPENPHRILVVRQHDQLGDMLLVVPLLRALKTRYPESKISLVASPVNYGIMRHNPYLDEVLNYDKAAFRKSPLALPRFIGSLRGRKFDLALVPATVSLSFTSDMLALASAAPVRIGPANLGAITNQSAFCFTSRIDLEWMGQPHAHQTLRNLDLVRKFGITETDLSSVIGLTEAERHSASDELAKARREHRPIVGFHPGAGKVGNRWPADRFAAVANFIAKQYGAAIYVTSGPMDAEPVKSMRALMQCEYEVVDKRPIREVAALIDGMDLFISNDTGVMHIAGGVSPTLVGLFGPTDALQWAPKGEKNRWIQAKDGNIATISTQEVLDMANQAMEQVVARRKGQEPA